MEDLQMGSLVLQAHTYSRNLYIVSLNYQLLIVIVNWLLFSSGTSDDTPSEWFFNIWKHGIVALTILIDFTLNRIPIYLSQWTTPLVIAILYIAWGISHLLIDRSSPDCILPRILSILLF
jgi:hypothetical protein